MTKDSTEKTPWIIEPSGDSCLIVEFPIAADTKNLVYAAASKIASARLPGVVDIVPAINTVGVHYQPWTVWMTNSTRMPFEVVSHWIDEVLKKGTSTIENEAPVIEIPVCYGGEYGPDLDEVATTCGVDRAEVIKRHCAITADVLMLGFAPGHPYIGYFDDLLSVPRRATPRTVVPAGSVGLANRQTVIYPMDSPGGWSIIGQTPLKLFDPYREKPCLLQAGYRVQFIPISPDVFQSMQRQINQEKAP